MTNLRSVLFAVSAFASVIVFSAMMVGCGSNTTPLSNSPITGNAFQGTVFGGSQPIVGATIKLYAASTNGYGQPYTAYPAGNTSLLTSAVTTVSGGGFSIGGGIFTCPTYSTPVYLVATGGNPGLPNGGNNANIGLMTALGPCGDLNQNTHIKLNELTTVASVWALSPFMSGIAGVGTGAGNLTGLTNAFATVNKLVDTSVGNLPGPALPPGATLPVRKMNTIADLLATCVNSPGGVATDTSTACGALFNAATLNNVAPTDTITAALNLAQNPNLGVSLSGNIPSTAPFQPTLAEAPNDLGIVITYSGGGLSTPTGVAADGSGNIWVSNAGNNSLSKLDALGVSANDSTGFLSGANGFTTGPLSGPAAVAIDQSGFAWVTNGRTNTVAKISPDGSASVLFQGGGLSGPAGISIDAGGNAWVVNSSGASVTLINTSGSLSNFNGGGIASPNAIAIDPK